MLFAMAGLFLHFWHFGRRFYGGNTYCDADWMFIEFAVIGRNRR